MKKAISIKEIRQVFRFNEKYLSEEDSNVYENLYEKEMSNLEIDIEDSHIHYDTFYITGQSGNGKSTAVNHLKNTNPFIKDNYDVRHIFASDIFDYSDEVTIIDVLLMVGIALVKGNKDLEEAYYKKLQELKDINVGKLEKSINEEKIDEDKSSFSAYAKGEVGFLSIFKFGADLEKEFNTNEKSRTLLRKLFLPNRQELLNLINKIIDDYNSKKENKKLFLILDDLEKRQVSNELFTKHKELLEKLEVLKIIMIPVNYATSRNVYKLNLRLNKNPIDSLYKDNGQAEKNIKSLKNLVYKRLDKKHQDLIPDTAEVIDKLIEYSGGNIRQLLRLISDSARNSRRLGGEAIGEKDVQEAFQEYLNMLAIGIVSKLSFLKYVNKYNIADENEHQKFKESIADNTIFAYFNGQPWYEVNPVLKNYIENIRLS